ncbi:phage-associated protein, HI1409 family [Selenomonas sputigena ATCC 35185]|uniref:Phage-associated protein, HI1409 family n=2 Tax=Selenomonas sputigena (strain ATCC 35185 / DSM 20758 / CCUG 44933 / VPI D19B-28) TaxID=546271 RepID=C9LU78_SELS3|nr:phage-associated protein, HI1409 family [Selenomonas sputigena ATCC 35185]
MEAERMRKKKKTAARQQRTNDSFQNPMTRTGVFMPNPLETTEYPLTRFTRDWQTINALYRSHWIVRRIIDVVPEDMIKNGYHVLTQLSPDQIKKIVRCDRTTRTSRRILEGLKWGRLYGGAGALIMIEGHENQLDQPLDYDTIMPSSYKGLLVLDRWSGVTPEDKLVSDISDPEFGMPEYYTVSSDALTVGIRVHHSRILRFMGRPLPYLEQLAETYWGASELEHVIDELKKRDNVSWNIAMLTFMANLRVMKMDGMSQVLAVGNEQAQMQLYNTIQGMNAMMNNNSLQVLGENDSYETHQYTFGGIGETYDRFMMDVAGAAETPVTKLFGRSPAGMNATGESDMQNYYDTIEEKQEAELRPVYDKILPIMFISTLGGIPDDWDYEFNPIRRPRDDEMADLASKNTDSVTKAFQAGMVSQRTALKELRQQSEMTGMWSNITDEDIEKADDSVMQPDEGMGELMGGMFGGAQEAEEPQPQRTSDAKWDEEKHPRRENGQFGTGSTNTEKSDSVRPSPNGANRLQVRGFANKQRLMNHWKNGRTHREEYPGLTMEQYVERAVRLAEMPTGRDILGHIDKDGIVVRYDRKENDFVKANVKKGIRTLFKPVDGEAYYIKARKDDIEHGGKD